MSMKGTNFPYNVELRELEGSPTYNIGEGGVYGERTFKVKEGLLSSLILALRGNPFTKDAPSKFPLNPQMLCTSIMAQPFPGTRGNPTKFLNPTTPENPTQMSYEYWRVTARYQVPTVVTYRQSAEVITLPSGRLQFGTGATKEPIPASGVVRTVNQFDLTVTRRNVLYYPKTVAKYVGAVNSVAFDPFAVENAYRETLTWDYSVPKLVPNGDAFNPTTVPAGSGTQHAAGCVLFLGVTNAQAVVDAFEIVTWDVTYSFVVRPDYAPWNKFFRPSAAVSDAYADRAVPWQELNVVTDPSTGATSTYKPYPSLDLAQLWTDNTP